MAGKAINVKIATAKVIKALEEKQSSLETAKKEQAKNEAEFRKVMEKWHKEIGAIAVKAIGKATDVSSNVRYNGEISVSFSLPKGAVEIPDEPKKEFDTYNDWQYKEMLEEIGNAIRILKMTDEEVVSTSTYNSIAKYL
jgi:hypothetical protein